MTPSEITLLQICVCGDANCTIPYGLCHCGCSGKTLVSKVNKPKQKLIIGLPMRFIYNHYRLRNGRTQNAAERMEYAREYRKKNEKEIRSKRKKYNQDTKESRAAYNKRYREENLEVVTEKGKLNNAYYSQHFPEKFLLWSAKRRAKAKHLPFNIEESDIRIPTVCPILGIPLKRGVAYGTKTSPSIDRIIPQLGYVKGNIQIISKMANVMKQDATFEQIVKLGEWASKMINERGMLRLGDKDAKD